MEITKAVQSVVLSLAVLATCSMSFARLAFYVAPDGSDDNVGSEKAPFATIEKARDAIRALDEKQRGQGIAVVLRGGTYVLDETIVLGLQDGGPEGSVVSYEAYPGEVPVISSGKTVTGWTLLKDPPASLPAAAKGKVYVADVPKQWGYFTSLFDGDERLVRAHGPIFHGEAPEYVRADSQNVFHAKDRPLLRRMPFPEGAIKDWPNLSDIEVFFDPVPWCLNFIPIESVDTKNRIATLRHEANSPPFAKSHHGAWVENVIDFLDKPGRWVLNTQEGKLYYWPESGKPSENIVAPFLRELIRVEGKINYDEPQDVPVKNLRFKGLTFKHARRSQWHEKRKGWGIQHDWDTFDYANAMLRFRGAEDCTVTECHFTVSGGSGMRLDLHCQNIRITNNLFGWLGHMGVLLAGYGPGTKYVNKNNVIHNNIIHHVGQLIWHGHGIFLWQSGENQITHNWIHEVPRKAVGVAGVRCQILIKPDCDFDEASKTIRWAEINKVLVQEGDIQERYLPFLHARKNRIEHNRVTQALMQLGDGASINVSGAGAGNVVRHNFVYNVHSVAIRTDDWQRYTTTEKNIVWNCGQGFIHKDFNHIRNNIVVECDSAVRFRLFPKEQVKPGSEVARNIIYSTDPRFKPMTAMTYLQKDIKVDHNLYFLPAAKEVLEKQHGFGVDKNSVVGDPMFKDVKGGDFRLDPASPALKLGFEEFDVNPDSFGLTDGYPERLRKLDPPVKPYVKPPPKPRKPKGRGPKKPAQTR